MKKTVVLLLIVCLCASAFAGCSTLHGEDDKGANISMFLTSFPQSLDPAAVQYTADTAMIFSLIYQPLTAIDEKGNVVGALAESWYSYYDDRDEVYKLYFKLKETYWSDNIRVQAQHVADAWIRILSPETQSPYASLLFPIRNALDYKAGIKTEADLGVYAESDDLLCIELEKEYDIDLFAETVSCIALSPIRLATIEFATSQNKPGSKGYDRLQDWDKNAAIVLCNGPFRVQGYEEGNKLVLERNNYYYRDPDEDRLDKSVVPFRITCIYQENTLKAPPASTVDNYTYEYNRYVNGETFFLSAFSKDTFASAGAGNTHDLLSTYTYFFNTNSELLKNAKTRQALSAALDRTAVVNALGVGYKASTGFVPNGVFGADKKTDFRKAAGDIYSATADESKAKQLLSEGGVTSGSLTLCYLVPRSEALYTDKLQGSKKEAYVKQYNPYEIIAEQAKQAWEKLGFTVNLKPVIAESYHETLSSGEWDIFGIDFAVNSVDAMGYLAPFATRTSGNAVSIALDSQSYTPHYTGLENADYDKIIEEAIYVSDRAKRFELLSGAEKLLAELCPATAVFQYTRSYVISDQLSKLITDSWYGYFDLHDLRLKDYIEVNARETEASIAADVEVDESAQ